MYRPSQQPRTLAPAAAPRRASLVSAGLPLPGSLAPAGLPLPGSLAPEGLRRPASFTSAGFQRSASPEPAASISTGGEEFGIDFPSVSFSQLAPATEDSDAHHGMPEDLQFEEENGFNGATQSGYFTGLLVNDGHASQIAAHTSDPVSNETPEAAKSSQRRTKNFSSQEDKLLVSAWLNVSMDAIQGVDQTQGTYWARIHEYFHANKEFESTRTEVSLLNRWSTILHDVNTFCGCLTRIEAMNQSGSRVDDKIASACDMYKAEDKNHRKFTLMHCWNILKDKPKWIERKKEIGGAKKSSNKKQKTMANSSPAAADANGSDAQPPGRPDGKKMEKQKLRQGRTMEAVEYLMAKKKEGDLEKELKKEERCKTAFALQEERILLEREKFEFQKRQAEKDEEERILGLDLSTMNYKQQQYYEDRQNEILAKRCNN